MAKAGLNVGVIGMGHWGPNYVRNFLEISEVASVACCDADPKRLERAAKRFPTLQTTADYHDFLSDPAIHAVVVATPASTHYALTKEALEAGKDVLAEKPLTLVPEEALALHRLAVERGCILMVAHTFLYNAGIVKVKEMIDTGRLGRIYYLNATRTHLGLLRDDVNVVWDLAPHDVAIFNYLLGSSPLHVSAVGACHLKNGREDVAFINLIYPNNVIANIHVSWEDSNKERTIRVVGSKARVVFDDINNLERVKLYEKGIGVAEDYDDFGEFQLNLRDGDIISPKVPFQEPMAVLCEHFVSCVRERKTPLTDGMSGYEVVRVVSEVMASIRAGTRK